MIELHFICLWTLCKGNNTVCIILWPTPFTLYLWGFSVSLSVGIVFIAVYSILVKVEVSQLCPTLCDPMDYTVHGILQARILERVAMPSFRESSQPRDRTQDSRIILYQLSHRGTPRILEWVTYSFSSRSSQLRNWTGVSCIAGGFFTSWATREAHSILVMFHSSFTRAVWWILELFYFGAIRNAFLWTCVLPFQWAFLS